MQPFTDLGEARRAIDAFAGPAHQFALPIADSLNDPMGMNMAILTDAILGKGWEPAGFEQQDGYRVYRYQELTD